MGETAGLLFMGTAALGQAASSLITANAQGTAIEAQGEYQKKLYEMNARLAEMQANDALKRGNREEYLFAREVKRTIGAQRASYAAQGVEIDDGSALELQLDTASEGQMQLLTIRNNAYREAWGYKTEALQSSFKGEIASSTSKFEAGNTYLTGGINALNYLTRAGGNIASAYPSNSKTTEPKKEGTGAFGRANYLTGPMRVRK